MGRRRLGCRLKSGYGNQNRKPKSFLVKKSEEGHPIVVFVLLGDTRALFDKNRDLPFDANKDLIIAS